MEYNLVRSNRKTLAIKITPDCKVIVHAPKKCSLKYIEDFVISKQKWIDEKLKLQRKNANNNQKYAEVNNVLIFGNDYEVKDTGKAYVFGEYYIKHSSASNRKKLVKNFLIKLSYSYMSERTKIIASKLVFSYKDVDIMSSRRNWGSCDNIKHLKFNFRLIMLPKPMIDYVICHELCHTKQMNHSKEFWALLQKIGYKKTEVKHSFANYGFVLQLF